MLNDVQILRAAAALGVVMVHIALFNSAALGVWFEFGRYGVDLFFVISGFVMIYTVSKRPVTGWEFMRNRIIRIVPMYWAFTLGVYLLVLLWPAALKSTTNDPLDLIKSLFFIPYRKGNGLMHPVLFLGWTLNYEMFFYAIFACSLSIRTALTRAITMIAILALLVIIGQLAKPTSDIATFYTSPVAGIRLWDRHRDALSLV